MTTNNWQVRVEAKDTALRTPLLRLHRHQMHIDNASRSREIERNSVFSSRFRRARRAIAHHDLPLSANLHIDCVESDSHGRNQLQLWCACQGLGGDWHARGGDDDGGIFDALADEFLGCVLVFVIFVRDAKCGDEAEKSVEANYIASFWTRGCHAAWKKEMCRRIGLLASDGRTTRLDWIDLNDLPFEQDLNISFEFHSYMSKGRPFQHSCRRFRNDSDLTDKNV